MNNARQGKVARLPAEIREELNLRLFNGERGRTILGWINGLEIVKRICEEDAEGLAINDSNLSNWRRGGYQDWLNRRERLARTKELAAYSVQLAGAAGGNLTEGTAAILSGKLLGLLETIEAQTGDADEKLSPEALAAATAALASISESLTALRAGDQENRRFAEYQKRTEVLQGKLAQSEQLLTLEKEKHAARTCELFLQWFADSKARQIAESGESAPDKVAKLRGLYFRDVDALEQSGEVRLPA